MCRIMGKDQEWEIHRRTNKHQKLSISLILKKMQTKGLG